MFSMIVADENPPIAAERALLARLAEAGKPTEVDADDLALGRILETRGLVFFVRNGAFAIITPKGRNALGSSEPAPRKPLGYVS
jgi:hypothetical protein